MPRIRAAVKIGQPPLAVLFEEPGRDWTSWDYRLVKGYEIKNDLETGAGVPIYWDRSDRVDFTHGVVFSKSRAALDRAEEKEAASKTKSYGKSFYPIPIVKDGGALPTLAEWLAEEALKKEAAKRVKRPTGAFDNSNWTPPTPN